jgi:hypothetical protein
MTPDNFLLSAETAAKIRRLIDAETSPYTTGVNSASTGNYQGIVKCGALATTKTDDSGTVISIYSGIAELLLASNFSYVDQGGAVWLADLQGSLLQQDKRYLGMMVGIFTFGTDSRPLFVVVSSAPSSGGTIIKITSSIKTGDCYPAVVESFTDNNLFITAIDGLVCWFYPANGEPAFTGQRFLTTQIATDPNG